MHQVRMKSSRIHIGAKRGSGRNDIRLLLEDDCLLEGLLKFG